MRLIQSFVMLFLVLVFSGCASVPTSDINVVTEVDPAADLSGYTSYGWLGTAAIINDPYGQWEPPQFDADSEIKFLIDSELRKRGMSETTTNPDLIALFAAGIDMEALQLEPDTQANIEVLKQVPKGALVVILIDSATGKGVWVGMASAEVQQDIDMETAKARLRYVVTEMFKELPK